MSELDARYSKRALAGDRQQYGSRMAVEIRRMAAECACVQNQQSKSSEARSATKACVCKKRRQQRWSESEKSGRRAATEVGKRVRAGRWIEKREDGRQSLGRAEVFHPVHSHFILRCAESIASIVPSTEQVRERVRSRVVSEFVGDWSVRGNRSQLIVCRSEIRMLFTWFMRQHV